MKPMYLIIDLYKSKKAKIGIAITREIRNTLKELLSRK
jgi:hypothetical protein